MGTLFWTFLKIIPAAGRFSRRPNQNATLDLKNVNNFFFSSSFLRRENQNGWTSSQLEGSELIEGVLWVHGAWENGDHINILIRGRGFREISKLTYHSERAKHVRNRRSNQNRSNPVQISFLYWRRPAAGQGPVGPSSNSFSR